MLGLNIKAKRLEKGWTQEQLAEATGITRNSIATFETGLRLVNSSMLSSIVKALGNCTADDLLFGTFGDRYLPEKHR